MRKSKHHPGPPCIQQNIQKPTASKQQAGKRAETKSKALGRRIPSILQAPALSSSLRTAATLGMPAATLDQRAALLLPRVLHFCSCFKESNRQWGVCSAREGTHLGKLLKLGGKMGDTRQAQPALVGKGRKRRGVRSLCVLGRGASQHIGTVHSVGRRETHGQEACTGLEGPRERWAQGPSSQPALKAGCVSKAAFRKR